MSIFSATDVRFLQQLVAERPPRRAASQAGQWFVDHYRLGFAIGRHIEYGEPHFAQARELLEAHGFPVEALGKSARRADVARYAGMSEKSGALAPWSNSVAVQWHRPAAVTTADATASFLGSQVGGGGFAVLTVECAAALPCAQIMVVENLETFRWLDEYPWVTREISVAAGGTLVVYRGDATTSAADSAKLLECRNEPVLAFVDFDPAGLGIAMGLPRLQRVVLPERNWLRGAARGTRAIELYERSRGQYEALLDRCGHPAVADAWEPMRRWRAGVAQEAMRAARPAA